MQIQTYVSQCIYYIHTTSIHFFHTLLECVTCIQIDKFMYAIITITLYITYIIHIYTHIHDNIYIYIYIYLYICIYMHLDVYIILLHNNTIILCTFLQAYINTYIQTFIHITEYKYI